MTQPALVDVLDGEERAFALEQMGAGDIDRAFERVHAAERRCSESVDDATLLSITIHEGKKRQVKRMCSAIGHPVLALHRPSFGPLALGDLPRGEWRVLTNVESVLLQEAIGNEGDPRG